MAAAPLGFQLHALAAFFLFALWPFTRLVHVFSAPVGYLWRPYVVYRSRDTTSARASRGGAGSGWAGRRPAERHHRRSRSAGGTGPDVVPSNPHADST
jgi:nitrate reductase gamma subunit